MSGHSNKQHFERATESQYPISQPIDWLEGLFEHFTPLYRLNKELCICLGTTEHNIHQKEKKPKYTQATQINTDGIPPFCTNQL